MSGLLSIGDFSRISQLTVKALRFYHEKGLLVPARVEAETGYRFYSRQQVEVATVIRKLRDLDFSIREIQEFIADGGDEHDILGELESKRDQIAKRLSEDRRTQQRLSQIINQVREERRVMAETSFEIVEKTLEPVLVAGTRIRGKYSDCGKVFGQIGRNFGSKINGKAMLLHYDTEYKETDADFEPCMPVKAGKDIGEITVRELPATKCVSVVHQGPYDTLRTSYERVLTYVADKGYEVTRPTREVYLKGPGMIFKGNPKKYLTEIQITIADA